MSIQANPFRRRTIMAMFIVGFLAFIALLYGMGTGDRLGASKNGQAHVASNSSVGYQALAELLREMGSEVQYARSPAAMDTPGLLILTPPPFADAEKLGQIMQDRAYVGPTLVVLPKWNAATVPTLKRGWVQRFGLVEEEAAEKLLAEIVDVDLAQGELAKGRKSRAIKAPTALPVTVNVPRPASTISGDYVRAIVREPGTGGALVAYVDDGGVYAQLDSLEESQITDPEDVDESYFPLIIVADADLLNNGGLADRQVARHALALLDASAVGSDGTIVFDLTLNGLGSSANLLTLVFEPPFLSATICLILAGAAAAWMAFYRFGPPTSDQRSIDFGKTALVNNSAGFIMRMQREHLVAGPYAALIEDRAARRLGLPLDLDSAQVREALDQLGEYRGSSYSQLAWDLQYATNAREMATAAAALYRWKKEKVG